MSTTRGARPLRSPSAPDVQIRRSLTLQPQDLRFDRIIGSGGSGEVWLGHYSQTHQDVAIKKLRCKSLTPEIRHEIEIHSQLNSNFVLPFIGYTEIAPLCIVTEFMPNGSLFSALHNPGATVGLSPTDLTTIALAVAMGMEFIHGRRIIHRDLKSLNILLDKRNQPRIGDFGISLSVFQCPTRSEQKQFGTAGCMAPEEHRNEAIDESVDVYSYGILLWEMLTKELPFEGRDPVQIIYAVAMKGERPIIPEGSPAALTELIERCWAQDCRARPAFSEIVSLIMNGTVEFPGTSRKAFVNFLSAFGGRRMRRETAPVTPVNVQNGLFESDPVQISVCDIVDALTKRTDVEAVGQSLKAIEQSSGIQMQLGVTLWTLLFGLIVPARSPPPAYARKAQALLEKLAKNHERVQLIRELPNLYTYVQPDTLDIFLYIISFSTGLIQPKLVTALKNIVASPMCEPLARDRAVRLLCKILDHTRDAALRAFVVKFMRRNAEGALDETYGWIMLKCAVRHWANLAKLPGRMLPIAMKYLSSKHGPNIAAGYEVVMGLAPDATLIPFGDCLEHLQIQNEELQRRVLEYLRRKFVNALDAPDAALLVQVLLNVYARCRVEQAAILLFHLASSPNHAAVFQNIAIQNQFLEISADCAADLIQLLVLQTRMDVRILRHPSISIYLASVLKYGNDEAFVVICLILDRAEATPELLAKLEEKGVLGMICERISVCESSVVVKHAARVLVRFAQARWFDAFRGVVQPLAAAVIHGGVDAAPCVVALSMLSRYDQLAGDIADSKVGDHLTPFYGLSQMIQLVQFLHGRIRACHPIVS
jgi:serine/threonine protein kinase